MATSTYTPISSIVLSADATEVTFSSIPQNYRDLILVSNFMLTDSGAYGKMYLNNASSFPYVYMRASDQTENSASGTVSWVFLGLGDTTHTATCVSQIMGYSLTNVQKVVLSRQSYPADNRVRAETTTYESTTSVTQIDIDASAGNLKAGSSFSLYGIEA